MLSFQDLNLNPKILTALQNKGYTTPTPIQLQAIPHLIAGKDILGIAQTGTGKTAAFSLPILHNLFASNISVKSGNARALILTPTRELASQIADNIELYGKDLNLRYSVIFGGVSERPQIAAMQRGVDILIATPGRLLDLMSQGYIRFMQLEVLVLDEADRMLDMGFINDIKKIIAKIPTKRQTLFFSATMPETITDLAHSILKDPVKIEVTPQSTTVERIEQKINFVERSNKLSLLKRILKQEDAKTVLIFSKTKHGANKIVEFLEKNSISVSAIHGNKSQTAREKALASFREGKVQALVATDIAARGIDIPDISYVINYDIPMDPESYVHRIGRTARAGRQGIAISFCDPSERKLLQAVEKTINFKIPVDDTHPFHGVAPAPISREFNEDDRSSRNRRPAPRSQSSRGDGRNSLSSSSRRAPLSNSNHSGRPPQKRIKIENKSGILDFIGLGKKKATNHRTSKAEEGENKKGGFGFGWFKSKKPADKTSLVRSGFKPKNREESSGLRTRKISSPRSGNNFRKDY
jgi:ATP-dependent RNA helicase RhlE